jgi:hypothetical protein
VLPAPLRLPPAAFVAVVLLVAALPILLRNWRVGLLVFLAWLVVEDLVRKFAGNDLTVYFVKDAFFLVFLAGFFTDPQVRGSWRAATGSARVPLYVLLGWALLMSVPTFTVDWRLALAGLRLDFLYVPLVAAGFLVARDSLKLRRVLLTLAIVGGVSSAVGVIQAFLGPTFLAPTLPTPGLDLQLIRGLPGQDSVFRPTGTFVDSGRYDSMAFVALAVSLAALSVLRGTARLAAACCLIASTAGIWVSGGRLYLLGAAALLIIAILAGARPAGLGRGTWAVAAPVGLVALALIALVPSLYSSRLDWYANTLDPRSPFNEWTFRWDAYSGDITRGVQLGGLIGQGTGDQSLGKQYVLGAAGAPSTASYWVEGGYASVAVEWGLIGLTLWLAWSAGWTWRLLQLLRGMRDGPFSRGGIVLFGWIALFLFIHFVAGYQVFQNYIGNAYFWLFSGMLFGAAQNRPGASKEKPVRPVADARI